MNLRAVALGCACSYVLAAFPCVVRDGAAAANATDLGPYVVGAGLGALLGSVLYRNNNRYGYNYRQGGGYPPNLPQPKVVNGYYWDGFAGGYGPVVVPPPGFMPPPPVVITNVDASLLGASAIAPAAPMPVPMAPGVVAPPSAMLAAGAALPMMPPPTAMFAMPAQTGMPAMGHSMSPFAFVGGRHNVMPGMMSGRCRQAINVLGMRASRRLSRYF